MYRGKSEGLDLDSLDCTILPCKCESHRRVPQVIKSAFFIGVDGGRGVVSGRRRTRLERSCFFSRWRRKRWTAGWGFGTDIVLLFMYDEAVDGLTKHKFELGAEAALAGGPVCRGASAGTDALM